MRAKSNQKDSSTQKYKNARFPNVKKGLNRPGKLQWKALVFPGLIFLVLPFIYFPGILDPVLVPRMLMFMGVSIFLLIYLSIEFVKGGVKASLFTYNLFWVYLIFILLTGVSVIMSINPGEGIWEFLKELCFFLLYVAGVLFLQDIRNLNIILPKLVMPFSAIIISSGIYNLIGVLQSGILDHESSYAITGFFAHRNLYAQVLLFNIPFLLMGIYFLSRLWRILSIVLLIFTLVLITLLLVKSVWLALIVSVLFCLVILLLFRKKFEISFPRFRKLLVLIFGAFMVVIVSIAVYSKYNTFTTFEKQTYVIGNYKFGSAIERVHLWEKSFEMFKDHPVIGIGLGNWKIYLPHYGTSGMRSAQGEIIYQRPHNDFLWVLAERGNLSLIFFGLIFFFSVVYLFRVIQSSPRVEDKYFALLLLFFIIAYGIASSLSFPMERPTHKFFFVLVLILTTIKYQEIKKEKSFMNSQKLLLSAVMAILILGFAMYVGVQKYQSELHTKKALNFRLQSNWTRVADEIDQADSYYTKLDPTATPLRWYSGLSRYNLGKMDLAMTDFQEAYKANPWHMHVLNNLATSYGGVGDYEAAILYYEEALRISPDFTDAALNLSASYYNIHQLEKANKVLRTVVDGDSNPNYQNIVTAIVYDKVEALKKTLDERELVMSLTRIRNSKEWMLKVHQQSINDGISLDQRLLVEVIYVLETEDQAIDSARAASLREKYIKH